MHVCIYTHIHAYIYSFSGYYSVVRYITGKDAFPFCGLSLPLIDCFFRPREAFWFYEISLDDC